MFIIKVEPKDECPAGFIGPFESEDDARRFFVTYVDEPTFHIIRLESPMRYI